MSNDNPEDVAMDLISSTYFDGCSLSKTIIGPPENIKRFDRDDLLDYMRRYYTASNIVIAVAGNFEEQQLKDILNRHLTGINQGELFLPAFSDCGGFETEPQFCTLEKDTEQVHLCMGMPCYNMHDNQRFALNILNNIVGGSMSSRLFQKIREEMGMAYSVFTYPALYRDAGMYGVYAGTMAGNADCVTELILKELMLVKKHGITEQEFLQGKEQLKGSMILSLESTSSKMSAIGKAQLLTGSVYSDDEVLAHIDAVKHEEIREIIDYCIRPELLTATCVGKGCSKDTLQKIVEENLK